MIFTLKDHFRLQEFGLTWQFQGLSQCSTKCNRMGETMTDQSVIWTQPTETKLAGALPTELSGTGIQTGLTVTLVIYLICLIHTRPLCLVFILSRTWSTYIYTNQTILAWFMLFEPHEHPLTLTFSKIITWFKFIFDRCPYPSFTLFYENTLKWTMNKGKWSWVPGIVKIFFKFLYL